MRSKKEIRIIKIILSQSSFQIQHIISTKLLGYPGLSYTNLYTLLGMVSITLSSPLSSF